MGTERINSTHDMQDARARVLKECVPTVRVRNVMWVPVVC